MKQHRQHHDRHTEEPGPQRAAFHIDIVPVLGIGGIGLGIIRNDQVVTRRLHGSLHIFQRNFPGIINHLQGVGREIDRSLGHPRHLSHGLLDRSCAHGATHFQNGYYLLFHILTPTDRLFTSRRSSPQLPAATAAQASPPSSSGGCMVHLPFSTAPGSMARRRACTSPSSAEVAFKTSISATITLPVTRPTTSAFTATMSPITRPVSPITTLP